jgi:hypothetical protein
MSRSLFPLPPSASMACRGTALPFFIEYYQDDKIKEDKIFQTCNMHGKHKKCRKYFGKETNRLLRNAKVFFTVHKSPPLDTVLSQLNSVHTLTPFFFTINIDIILPFIKQWKTMARFLCLVPPVLRLMVLSKQPCDLPVEFWWRKQKPRRGDTTSHLRQAYFSRNVFPCLSQSKHVSIPQQH